MATLTIPITVEQIRELARQRLKTATQSVNELIERIERYGDRIDSNLDAPLGCRDPKDDYLLAVVLAGSADILLSEDEDLLVLDPWRGIRIMRLFQFLEE